MIHIPNMDFIISMLGPKAGAEARLGHGIELLERQQAKADDLWDLFSNYLSGQPQFDRIYGEGVYDRRVDFKFARRPGMQNCLADLSDTHAPFEKTESETLIRTLVRLRYPNARLKGINRLGDYVREEYVAQNIDATLKDGERGLLLFGAMHLSEIGNVLQRLPDTQLEIYPVGDDIEIINAKYD
jgi:hypothetical protein